MAKLDAITDGDDSRSRAKNRNPALGEIAEESGHDGDHKHAAVSLGSLADRSCKLGGNDGSCKAIPGQFPEINIVGHETKAEAKGTEPGGTSDVKRTSASPEDALARLSSAVDAASVKALPVVDKTDDKPALNPALNPSANPALINGAEAAKGLGSLISVQGERPLSGAEVKPEAATNTAATRGKGEPENKPDVVVATAQSSPVKTEIVRSGEAVAAEVPKSSGVQTGLNGLTGLTGLVEKNYTIDEQAARDLKSGNRSLAADTAINAPAKVVLETPVTVKQTELTVVKDNSPGSAGSGRYAGGADISGGSSLSVSNAESEHRFIRQVNAPLPGQASEGNIPIVKVAFAETNLPSANIASRDKTGSGDKSLSRDNPALPGNTAPGDNIILRDNASLHDNTALRDKAVLPGNGAGRGETIKVDSVSAPTSGLAALSTLAERNYNIETQAARNLTSGNRSLAADTTVSGSAPKVVLDTPATVKQTELKVSNTPPETVNTAAIPANDSTRFVRQVVTPASAQLSDGNVGITRIAPADNNTAANVVAKSEGATVISGNSRVEVTRTSANPALQTTNSEAAPLAGTASVAKQEVPAAIVAPTSSLTALGGLTDKTYVIDTQAARTLTSGNRSLASDITTIANTAVASATSSANPKAVLDTPTSSANPKVVLDTPTSVKQTELTVTRSQVLDAAVNTVSAAPGERYVRQVNAPAAGQPTDGNVAYIPVAVAAKNVSSDSSVVVSSSAGTRGVTVSDSAAAAAGTTPPKTDGSLRVTNPAVADAAPIAAASTASKQEVAPVKQEVAVANAPTSSLTALGGLTEKTYAIDTQAARTLSSGNKSLAADTTTIANNSGASSASASAAGPRVVLDTPTAVKQTEITVAKSQPVDAVVTTVGVVAGDRYVRQANVPAAGQPTDGNVAYVPVNTAAAKNNNVSSDNSVVVSSTAARSDSTAVVVSANIPTKADGAVKVATNPAVAEVPLATVSTAGARDVVAGKQEAAVANAPSSSLTALSGLTDKTYVIDTQAARTLTSGNKSLAADTTTIANNSGASAPSAASASGPRVVLDTPTAVKQTELTVTKAQPADTLVAATPAAGDRYVRQANAPAAGQPTDGNVSYAPVNVAVSKNVSTDSSGLAGAATVRADGSVAASAIPAKVDAAKVVTNPAVADAAPLAAAPAPGSKQEAAVANAPSSSLTALNGLTDKTYVVDTQAARTLTSGNRSLASDTATVSNTAAASVTGPKVVLDAPATVKQTELSVTKTQAGDAAVPTATVSASDTRYVRQQNAPVSGQPTDGNVTYAPITVAAKLAPSDNSAAVSTTVKGDNAAPVGTAAATATSARADAARASANPAVADSTAPAAVVTNGAANGAAKLDAPTTSLTALSGLADKNYTIDTQAARTLTSGNKSLAADTSAPGTSTASGAKVVLDTPTTVKQTELTVTRSQPADAASVGAAADSTRFVRQITPSASAQGSDAVVNVPVAKIVTADSSVSGANARNDATVVKSASSAAPAANGVVGESPSATTSSKVEAPSSLTALSGLTDKTYVIDTQAARTLSSGNKSLAADIVAPGGSAPAGPKVVLDTPTSVKLTELTVTKAETTEPVVAAAGPAVIKVDAAVKSGSTVTPSSPAAADSTAAPGVSSKQDATATGLSALSGLTDKSYAIDTQAARTLTSGNKSLVGDVSVPGAAGPKVVLDTPTSIKQTELVVTKSLPTDTVSSTAAAIDAGRYVRQVGAPISNSAPGQNNDGNVPVAKIVTADSGVAAASAQAKGDGAVKASANSSATDTAKTLAPPAGLTAADGGSPASTANKTGAPADDSTSSRQTQSVPSAQTSAQAANGVPSLKPNAGAAPALTPIPGESSATPAKNATVTDNTGKAVGNAVEAAAALSALLSQKNIKPGELPPAVPPAVPQSRQAADVVVSKPDALVAKPDAPAVKPEVTAVKPDATVRIETAIKPLVDVQDPRVAAVPAKAVVQAETTGKDLIGRLAARLEQSPGQPLKSDIKSSDMKSSDIKSTEMKPGEMKPGEMKLGEGKTGEAVKVSELGIAGGGKAGGLGGKNIPLEPGKTPVKGESVSVDGTPRSARAEAKTEKIDEDESSSKSEAVAGVAPGSSRTGVRVNKEDIAAEDEENEVVDSAALGIFNPAFGAPGSLIGVSGALAGSLNDPQNAQDPQNTANDPASAQDPQPATTSEERVTAEIIAPPSMDGLGGTNTGRIDFDLPNLEIVSEDERSERQDIAAMTAKIAGDDGASDKVAPGRGLEMDEWGILAGGRRLNTNLEPRSRKPGLSAAEMQQALEEERRRRARLKSKMPSGRKPEPPRGDDLGMRRKHRINDCDTLESISLSAFGRADLAELIYIVNRGFFREERGSERGMLCLEFISGTVIFLPTDEEIAAYLGGRSESKMLRFEYKRSTSHVSLRQIVAQDSTRPMTRRNSAANNFTAAKAETFKVAQVKTAAQTSRRQLFISDVERLLVADPEQQLASFENISRVVTSEDGASEFFARIEVLNGENWEKVVEYTVEADGGVMHVFSRSGNIRAIHVDLPTEMLKLMAVSDLNKNRLAYSRKFMQGRKIFA